MSEFRSPDQVLSATAPPLQTLAASVLDGLASTTHRPAAASTPNESTVNHNDRVPEAPIAEVQDRPFQLPTGVGAKRGKRLVKPEEATAVDSR